MDIDAVFAQSTTTTVGNPAADTIDSLTDLSQACGDEPSWACRWVSDWTGSDAWAGAADWLLAKPLAILLIVVGAWVVARILRAVVGRVVRRIADPSQSERLRRLRARAPAGLVFGDEENLRAEARASTLSTVARSITTGFVWFVALVAILDVVEINLGPLIAGAGIVGVALGFGAQSMVRDYLNGFFLVVEDQYGVGDFIDLGTDAKGVVERVTLRTTRIRAVDGTVWHVPNGEIRRVGNMTQDFAYAVLDVQVSLGVELADVEQMISSIAEDLANDPEWSGDITGSPDLWGLDTLTREGATLRLLLKTAPGAQWRVQRELRRRVKTEFDRMGMTGSLAGEPAPVVVGPTGTDDPAEEGTTPSASEASSPDRERGRRNQRGSGEDAVVRDSMEVAAELDRDQDRGGPR
jgi:small-conductance mechanosensitive channel